MFGIYGEVDQFYFKRLNFVVVNMLKYPTETSWTKIPP